MRGLESKRVLITGGSKGIGAATAKRFLEEGAAVCVWNASESGHDKIVKELPGLAGAVRGDLSDSTQVRRCFDEAVSVLGGLDVLVSNAGISVRENFLDISPEQWNKVLGINLTGHFFVSQLAAKHMMKRSGGAILFTASTSGVQAYPFYADYNASKGGLISLAKTMALELAPKIRVNAVNPGYTLTPMQRAEYSDAMFEEVNEKIPAGRHAAPEEIASLFAYLASDDAAYATGQVFTMDGGESTGTPGSLIPK